MYSCSYATLICLLRKVKTLIKEVPFYGEMIIMNTRLFITYWTVTCVRCLLVLDWTRWTQNNFLVYLFICSTVCFLVYLFFLHILKKIYVLSYPHLLFLPFFQTSSVPSLPIYVNYSLFHSFVAYIFHSSLVLFVSSLLSVFVPSFVSPFCIFLSLCVLSFTFFFQVV